MNNKDKLSILKSIRDNDKKGFAVDWNTAMRTLLDFHIEEIEQQEEVKKAVIEMSERGIYQFREFEPAIRNCDCTSVHPTIGIDYEAEYKKLLEQNKQMKAQLRVKNEIVNIEDGWVWTIDGIPMTDYVEQYDKMKEALEKIPPAKNISKLNVAVNLETTPSLSEYIDRYDAMKERLDMFDWAVKKSIKFVEEDQQDNFIHVNNKDLERLKEMYESRGRKNEDN